MRISGDAAAIVATAGQLALPYSKTAHGLVRGSRRFRVVGVIDAKHAGTDAGTLVDGVERGIPVFATVDDALSNLATRPQYLIVGCATPGGVVPPVLRADIIEAIQSGLSIVSGLHQHLANDRELTDLAREAGVDLIDVRKPAANPHYWKGEILRLAAPRIAVLGTDCGVGKRSTMLFLHDACIDAGIATEMVSTGQTGWMQGIPNGFILDAVPNDFVCGELERAILAAAESNPNVILLEGQAAFRHPAGPCGSEFIVSGGAKGVIFQHAPGRAYFEGYQSLKYRVPPIREDIEIARLLGAETLAVTLNGHGLTQNELRREQDRLREELQLPVCLPLEDGVGEVVSAIQEFLRREAAA